MLVPIISFPAVYPVLEKFTPADPTGDRDAVKVIANATLRGTKERNARELDSVHGFPGTDCLFFNLLLLTTALAKKEFFMGTHLLV